MEVRERWPFQFHGMMLLAGAVLIMVGSLKRLVRTCRI